jgi:hypothetical protein
MLTDAEKLARFERTLAYAGPTHTVENVRERIKLGLAQWWDNEDGCIVSEIIDLPLVKMLHLWLISGELKSCLALESRIEAFARDIGCNMMTANGRRGWGRVASPTGWDLHSYNFVKRLG